MKPKALDGEGLVLDIPLDQVDPSPYQPRRVFGDVALAGLADSIRRFGVQQPVVVRRRGDRFELVAGERRCRASRLAGKATVPAMVRELADEDAEELALIENVLREDLNPIEEAHAYGRLLERLGTLSAVAAAVSRPLQRVEWTCRFLGLRAEYQELVAKGQADPWRMNSLARVPSEQQPVVFRKIRAGITTMRYVIDRALEKHNQVRVRNVAGNHDPHASVTLTEALIGYYSKEPRVTIEDSPRAFFTYRFGLNLVGITHGHTGKPERLPGILAVDAQKDWGECEFKYVWHGHIHNKKVFEDMGVIVESFRTLAAKDAWHAEMGYRPGREMQAIVLHKEFGEIERHTAGLKRVRTNG